MQVDLINLKNLKAINKQTFMRKYTLFILVALLSLKVSFAQKVINNQLSARHQRIAGTNLFMIVPDGFIPSNSFQGFQQSSSGSSLLVAEVPGPFAELIAGFTPEALKSKGVIVKEKEMLTINGKKGVLFTTLQQANSTDYTKYILLLANGKTTFMVNGIFPKLLAQLDKPMREALLSIVHHKGKAIDPLEGISFEINVQETKLKFAQNLTGSLLYTVDGKVPTLSEDKTTFIVGLGTTPLPENMSEKEAAMNRLNKLPYTNLSIDETASGEVFVDGMKGYEIVAYGPLKDGNLSGVVYQMMLFNAQGYCLIIGTSTTELKENLSLFKHVARTFKRK